MKYYFSFLLLFTLAACSQPIKKADIPGYDLSKPEVYKMPSVLDEISGITFKSGNADTVYAEQDEEGKLFYMHPGDSEAKHVKFSKRGDYEDVSICNGIVIMLRSDGVLFTFPLSETTKAEAENVKEQSGLLPAGEYESMYADEATNTLYVLCKSCSGNKKGQVVSGYTFKINADGLLSASATFSINEKEIAALAGVDKINLKASAMAKNQSTKEWFIVSSVNRMLLVTDDQWKATAIYPLAPVTVFTQPEGIAFDAKRNLYISNENGGTGTGTILKFSFQNK